MDNSLPTSFPHKVKRGGAAIPIYQIKNGSYLEYRVVWYDPQTGIRKQKSYADFQDAKSHAQDHLEKQLKGENNALTLTNEDQLIYRRAIEFLKPAHTPLDIAAREYAAAKRLLNGSFSH